MKTKVLMQYDRLILCYWFIGCFILIGCSPDQGRTVSRELPGSSTTSLPFFSVPTPEQLLTPAMPLPTLPTLTQDNAVSSDLVPTPENVPSLVATSHQGSPVSFDLVPTPEDFPSPVATSHQGSPVSSDLVPTPEDFPSLVATSHQGSPVSSDLVPTPEDFTQMIPTSGQGIAMTAMPQSVYQIFLPSIFYSSMSPSASSTDIPVPESPDSRITEIVIYDDDLDPNWSTEQSFGTSINLAATDYVYRGNVAAAITAEEGLGTFFLTVRNDSKVTYVRSEILGVSFRLNGGANIIENDDLAVTVLGSNAFPYWVGDDTSVPVEWEITNDFPRFSETRLYFLDINRSIPPNTWTEVIVWLDEREFDPIYKYITGIYIKNDEDLIQTYYVDHVAFLLERPQ